MHHWHQFQLVRAGLWRCSFGRNEPQVSQANRSVAISRRYICSCLFLFVVFLNGLFQCLFLFVVHLLDAGNRQHSIVVEWPNMAKPSEMILSLQYLIGVGAFWLWCEFPNQAAVEIAIWSSVAGSMAPLESTHGRSDMWLQTFVIRCDL